MSNSVADNMDLGFIEASIEKGILGSPFGRHSIFCKITDSVGAKIVLDGEGERDMVYERQEAASEHDLGPLVYGKFEFVASKDFKLTRIHGCGERNKELKEGQVYYGYLTEIVDMIDEDEYYKRMDESDALVDALQNTIEFDFYDIFDENVGDKNGKMVCIDFGD